MWQPKSAMRLSSPARSTVFSQFGDGLGGFLADAAHMRGVGDCEAAEDGRGLAEMFEQLADAHRADVLDHVQRHQRFPGIHGEIRGFRENADSNCSSNSRHCTSGGHLLRAGAPVDASRTGRSCSTCLFRKAAPWVKCPNYWAASQVMDFKCN